MDCVVLSLKASSGPHVAILNHVYLSLCQIGHLMIGPNQEILELRDRETSTLEAEFPCLSGKSFDKDGKKMPDITDAQFHVS